LHRDYLVSIILITDNIVNFVAEYTYDAWGQMRNPVNWQVYAQGSQPTMAFGGRGYTGHEQLNQFGIINMNARLYDPLLARFLAPDAQVSAPETSNGFNRYLYASNNPMMYVDINGEEVRLPWWWLGGKNNPSGGYQPDYKSNPGSNTGNNFHNNYTGPGSGNQGGSNSGYNGGNYGGNNSGNTTAAGSILFSFLSEIIYGSGSSDTKRSNPFVGLKFNPTVIQSATPARKPYTPLAKPVGTGASNVYSGGGSRRGGNNNSGVQTWDPITNFRISKLDIRIQKPTADFINDAYSQNIKLRITQGLRTFEEQNDLYHKVEQNLVIKLLMLKVVKVIIIMDLL